MATGRVFSGTHLIPPLMGRGLNLINGFGMGIRFFFKTWAGFGTGSGIASSCLVSSRLYIKLILKLN